MLKANTSICASDHIDGVFVGREQRWDLTYMTLHLFTLEIQKPQPDKFHCCNLQIATNYCSLSNRSHCVSPALVCFTQGDLKYKGQRKFSGGLLDWRSVEVNANFLEVKSSLGSRLNWQAQALRGRIHSPVVTL